MIEQDTIKLLRECDAGIKMGVKSIDDVLPYVSSRQLKQMLEECKRRHEKLAEEVEAALYRFQDDGKEPNAMAEAISGTESVPIFAPQTSLVEQPTTRMSPLFNPAVSQSSSVAVTISERRTFFSVLSITIPFKVFFHFITFRQESQCTRQKR